MTHAAEILMTRAGLADRIADRLVDRISEWKEARALRATYRETVKQLSDLGDRELNDLGINRGSISLVAHMAVYGK